MVLVTVWIGILTYPARMFFVVSGELQYEKDVDKLQAAHPAEPEEPPKPKEKDPGREWDQATRQVARARVPALPPAARQRHWR